jgi:hypothetical protein
MDPIPEDTTSVVRAGLERACREFTTKIEGLGFSRTKKMFWVRSRRLFSNIVHFHRSGSTYGKSLNYSVEIRVHFGIRVLNDTFEALALNGPFSDHGRLNEGRYHLRFNAKTGSTYDRCVEDLARFVREQGESWFGRFGSPEALLEFEDSPLRPQDKDRLWMALNGQSDPDAVARSLKLLGLKTSTP